VASKPEGRRTFTWAGVLCACAAPATASMTAAPRIDGDSFIAKDEFMDRSSFLGRDMEIELRTPGLSGFNPGYSYK
jgi:hypothetical protein